VSLLLNSDMLCLTHHHSLGQFPTQDALQTIAVVEEMPSLTVGLYTRADTPLTRVAAAMVRHVTAVAREVRRVASQRSSIVRASEHRLTAQRAART
jgi:hypothetical protein